jgi:hypothetical protein
VLAHVKRKLQLSLRAEEPPHALPRAIESLRAKVNVEGDIGP